ncbi:hypothetical protein JXA40_11610 [bacterium]|nr:hypothetical protein [candidate division CSSED10-310 bacterium]
MDPFAFQSEKSSLTIQPKKAGNGYNPGFLLEVKTRAGMKANFSIVAPPVLLYPNEYAGLVYHAAKGKAGTTWHANRDHSLRDRSSSILRRIQAEIVISETGRECKVTIGQVDRKTEKSISGSHTLSKSEIMLLWFTLKDLVLHVLGSTGYTTDSPSPATTRTKRNAPYPVDEPVEIEEEEDPSSFPDFGSEYARSPY